MDQAITIRTLVFHNDEYSYQAGAGIVADSIPAAEHDEALAKSAALLGALKLAEEGLGRGADVRVYRNDAITVEAARALGPTHLCISPGPGTPQRAGVSMALVRAFAGLIPGVGVSEDVAAGGEVGRYHSLIAEPDSMPAELEVSARTAEGEIMGVRHRQLMVEGVQFHPESVLTPDGPAIMQNFLRLSGGRRGE